MTRIAIVGGGFSGAMTAVHLARCGAGGGRDGLRILLFDRAARPARGVAYSTDCLAHLLNVPAARMSALPDEPDHFLRWAQARDTTIGPGSFVPRRLYGEYLHDLLAAATRRAPPAASADSRPVPASPAANAALTIHRDCVTAVAPPPEVGAAPTSNALRLRLPVGDSSGEQAPSALAGGVTLRTSSGAAFEVDRVVLALGNFPPATPSGIDADELGACWIGDPWDAAALGATPRDGAVLLIGAGLTGIDAALALDAGGHAGPIVALSRRGLAPHPHLDPPIRPPLPAPLNEPPPCLGPRELTRWLRGRARLAAGAGGDWRDVVDALRPHSQAIWRGWTQPQRRRFLERLRPWWDAHRHRMAPAASRAFEALRGGGRLRIVAGRLRGARRSGGAAEVLIQPRGASAPAALRVARVVNCTGPRSDYRRIDDALVADLRRQGLIRPDALELGLETATDGAVLTADGAPSEWLFTLGSPRRAELWESVAAPELRVQAAELARRLLA